MKMPPVLLPDGDGSGFRIAAAVGQDFFERIAAYGVSDGIFTFTEQVCGISCRLCGNFGYGSGRCYNNGLFLKGDIMEATVYLEDNEYIALCDLLKLAGLAESGGQAKAFIAEGLNKAEALLGEPLLDEPVRPESWECCGSDCGEACIQTIYWADKARYDAQRRKLKEAGWSDDAV